MDKRSDMDERSERNDKRETRYGAMLQRFNRLYVRPMAAAGIVALSLSAMAEAAPVKILAFGDSLFAGYGVADADNIPTRLEEALKAGGKDVRVINAAVSGDTTADGLARLDWSLSDKPDLVLLELGANDALRGLDPDRARANLDQILARLKTANIPVLICGMIAPRNLGAAYGAKFDPIFKDLAVKYDAPLYPFILDGVALDSTLNQADGMHPNAKGVAIVVKSLAPAVEHVLNGMVQAPIIR